VKKKNICIIFVNIFLLIYIITLLHFPDLSIMTYYAVLVLDVEVADSISSNILSANSPIILTDAANNVLLTNISITTDCSIIGQAAECRCQQNYTWSGFVCTLYPQCCLNQTFCKLNVSDNIPMCLPKKRVTVRGTLFIPDPFTEGLNNINSVAYTTLEKKVGDQVCIIHLYTTMYLLL
ncbi:adhesion G-protein coupled receptor F1-like, partial [Acipenser oxyrinchus oxyrinchus]